MGLTEADFERLFTKRSTFLGYARRMLGSRFSCEAEDLVQQTFFVAWQSRDSFRNESDPATWFTVVLRNICYSYARRSDPLASPVPVFEWMRQAESPVESAIFAAEVIPVLLPMLKPVQRVAVLRWANHQPLDGVHKLRAFRGRNQLHRMAVHLKIAS